jgi:HAD superfamily hydrolase (TIGR01509 family)
MGRLQGIFFDLDDTLIATSEAMQTALRAVLPLLPGTTLPQLADSLKNAYHSLWGYPSAGYLTLKTLPTATLRQKLTQRALEPLGFTSPSLHVHVAEQYEAIEREALRPLPGAEAVLRALRRRFHLGIITNGPSIVQREKLEQAGLASWFDIIVADSDFGVPKPDPALFTYAAGTLGLNKSELLFVGDSFEADITGANAAGWQSVYLSKTPCSEANFCITQLEEILTLAPLAQILTTKDLHLEQRSPIL